MLSVVIPVFNEAEILPQLYARLTEAARAWPDSEYEVIVVDDGSSDASLPGLIAISARDPRWKVLSFARNFGHQCAVSAGIHYASGDAIIVMDADLQDPPEEVGRFLEKWREGFHVVYAIRTKRKEGWLKRTAYAGFYRVLRAVSAIEIPLDSGDFCVMDRRVADVLRSMPERSRFVRGLRSWSGFRQVGVAYERQARQAGEVKYTFTKLVRLALDGIFSFSSLPLKLSSWLGMGLCAVSVVLIGMLVAWWAADVEILHMKPSHAAGWTSLCSLILLLTGLQFLVLGIHGEYLARVFEEAKGRPPWIIGAAYGFESQPSQATAGWFATEQQPSPLPTLRKAG
jgi:dolichol-phosphate mannosyltransferase